MAMYPEEFRTIAVDLVLGDSSITVIPRDSDASAMLQRVLDYAPDSLAIKSGGVSTDNGGVNGAYLNFGGESYLRVEGNVTSDDYAGAIKLHLDLTGVSPEAISKLRGYLWYNTRVEPSSTIDKFCLVPDRVCKFCGKSIVNFGEMEWSVCNECAAKCEHVYKKMVGHYNGNIALLPCCDRCGRMDPGFVPSDDPMEDTIRTVSEGPLSALVLNHTDGTTTTITKK